MWRPSTSGLISDVVKRAFKIALRRLLKQDWVEILEKVKTNLAPVEESQRSNQLSQCLRLFTALYCSLYYFIRPALISKTWKRNKESAEVQFSVTQTFAERLLWNLYQINTVYRSFKSFLQHTLTGFRFPPDLWFWFSLILHLTTTFNSDTASKCYI